MTESSQQYSGIAELQLGNKPGWHSRGYLPHIDADGLISAYHLPSGGQSTEKSDGPDGAIHCHHAGERTESAAKGAVSDPAGQRLRKLHIARTRTRRPDAGHAAVF